MNEIWGGYQNIPKCILICPHCGSENPWRNPSLIDAAVSARKKCYKCETFFDAKKAERKDYEGNT